MAGTKRLAVTGPWHGQMIEPNSDDYRSIRWEGKALILANEPVPEPVDYVPLSYPIPLVNGVAAMPLLVPTGISPTAPEVLDALVLAAFGQVQG